MNKVLAGLEHQQSEVVEENWNSLKATTLDTAFSVLAKFTQDTSDWFDDADKKARGPLEERNNTGGKKLQLDTRSKRTKLTGTRRNLQQYTRESFKGER